MQENFEDGHWHALALALHALCVFTPGKPIEDRVVRVPAYEGYHEFFDKYGWQLCVGDILAILDRESRS